MDDGHAPHHRDRDQRRRRGRSSVSTEALRECCEQKACRNRSGEQECEGLGGQPGDRFRTWRTAKRNAVPPRDVGGSYCRHTCETGGRSKPVLAQTLPFSSQNASIAAKTLPAWAARFPPADQTPPSTAGCCPAADLSTARRPRLHTQRPGADRRTTTGPSSFAWAGPRASPHETSSSRPPCQIHRHSVPPTLRSPCTPPARTGW